MAAVSLFWNTNMAAVTSCENALFGRSARVGTAYATVGLEGVFVLCPLIN